MLPTPPTPAVLGLALSIQDVATVPEQNDMDVKKHVTKLDDDVSFVNARCLMVSCGALAGIAAATQLRAATAPAIAGSRMLDRKYIPPKMKTWETTKPDADHDSANEPNRHVPDWNPDKAHRRATSIPAKAEPMPAPAGSASPRSPKQSAAPAAPPPSSEASNTPPSPKTRVAPPKKMWERHDPDWHHETDNARRRAKSTKEIKKSKMPAAPSAAPAAPPGNEASTIPQSQAARVVSPNIKCERRDADGHRESDKASAATASSPRGKEASTIPGSPKTRAATPKTTWERDDPYWHREADKAGRRANSVEAHVKSKLSAAPAATPPRGRASVSPHSQKTQAAKPPTIRERRESDPEVLGLIPTVPPTKPNK